MSNGISFLVRVHNEERTLEKSIKSLTSLKIPHEIIIILHNCTDSSEEIAYRLQQSNSRIKIYKYNYKLSKAGYETLCTDANSVHSLSFYLNWCLSKCKLNWKFKWDADFIISDPLMDYLNNELNNLNNFKIRIAAINSTSKNCEFYLSDNLEKYIKYYFWELPMYKSETKSIKLPDNICIFHDSELSDMKPYWKQTPWFKEENSEEAKIVNARLEQLILQFGVEPDGMARASNPACDRFFINIKNSNPTFINPHN